MRNLLLIFFFIPTFIIAQSKKKITGPKAKNQKIWNKTKKNTVFVIGNPEKLKLRSKDFKNYKPWYRKIYNKEETLIRKKKKQTFGGKAKNQKVWDN